MSETFVEEKPETAPVETPTPTATESSADNRSVDELLAEFDAKTAPPEPPEPATDNAGAQSDQTFEQTMQDLLGPDPKIQELQGQVDSLRAAEYRREELAAFDSFASDLQKDLPSWAPPDYARLKLESLAHQPEVALAWDLRNTDRAAANLELQRVQVALSQTADPARIQQLNQYGYRLQVAVNAPAILRKATLGILNEAKKLAPPIDDEQTAIRMELTQTIREGGSGRGIPPEPPPDFGNMTDNELRNYTKKHFGF